MAIKGLTSNKSSTLNDIPARVLKDSITAYSKILTKGLNKCLKEDVFPDMLKYSDSISVFNKGDCSNKVNYRSISTLSNFPNQYTL